MANLGIVAYNVMVRPVDSGGKVYRGLSSADSVFSQSPMYQFKGEPWLLFAVCYSLEQLRDSAKKAATSIGSENVKIVKVLPFDTNFTIS